MKTLEGLKEVIEGKRMAERTKMNYEAAFISLSRLYEELPERPVEINKWLVSLGSYSDTTVRLWFTCVRGGFDYLEVNYDIKNPCKGLDAPKVKRKKRRYFKAEEIVMVLQACKNDYETALIMTLVDSGCRVGGLPRLKGSDVGEGCIDLIEKTGERRYRLDARLCDLLKKMAGSDDGLVFGTTTSAISMKVMRICRRAGLKGMKLGPHTFRHSSASLVAQETRNALAVKALLGHDNIQTSMVYIHDVEEEIQKELSPLKLVGERVMAEQQGEMMMLADGKKSEGTVADVFEEEMVEEGFYPGVKEGIEVRPLLKSEDIGLIREAFIVYERFGKDMRNKGKARMLMRRILRKVK